MNKVRDSWMDTAGFMGTEDIDTSGGLLRTGYGDGIRQATADLISGAED